MKNIKEQPAPVIHRDGLSEAGKYLAPINYRLVVHQRSDDSTQSVPWGVDYQRGNIRISIRNFSMVGGLAGLIQSFVGIAITIYLMQCHRYKDELLTSNVGPYWGTFFELVQKDHMIFVMVVSHLLFALSWFVASLFMLTSLVFPKRTRNDAIKFSYAIGIWTTVTSLVCALDIVCSSSLIFKAVRYLSFFISGDLEYCIAKLTLRKITVLLIMSGFSCRFMVPWLINAACAFALCFASFQSATTLKL